MHRYSHAEWHGRRRIQVGALNDSSDGPATHVVLTVDDQCRGEVRLWFTPDEVLSLVDMLTRASLTTTVEVTV